MNTWRSLSLFCDAIAANSVKGRCLACVMESRDAALAKTVEERFGHEISEDALAMPLR